MNPGGKHSHGRMTPDTSSHELTTMSEAVLASIKLPSSSDSRTLLTSQAAPVSSIDQHQLQS